jgi:hypothetical protein
VARAHKCCRAIQEEEEEEEEEKKKIYTASLVTAIVECWNSD